MALATVCKFLSSTVMPLTSSNQKRPGLLPLCFTGLGFLLILLSCFPDYVWFNCFVHHLIHCFCCHSHQAIDFVDTDKSCQFVEEGVDTIGLWFFVFKQP